MLIVEYRRSRVALEICDPSSLAFDAHFDVHLGGEQLSALSDAVGNGGGPYYKCANPQRKMFSCFWRCARHLCSKTTV